MGDCTFDLGAETTTLNPEKARRQARRGYEYGHSDVVREVLRAESAALTESQEPELPEPVSCGSCSCCEPWREPPEPSIPKDDPRDAEAIFQRYYASAHGTPVTGVLREKAMAFLRKAADGPIAVGTVCVYGDSAWLVYSAGPTSWLLVGLDLEIDFTDFEPERVLDGIEACPSALIYPSTVMMLTEEDGVRREHFVRIGRVPKARMKGIIELVRSYVG